MLGAVHVVHLSPFADNRGVAAKQPVHFAALPGQLLHPATVHCPHVFLSADKLVNPALQIWHVVLLAHVAQLVTQLVHVAAAGSLHSPTLAIATHVLALVHELTLSFVVTHE